MTLDVKFDIARDDFNLKVDFSIPANGVTALFGPSGCGKTTLLRAIAGLHRSGGATLKLRGNIWQDQHVFLEPHRRELGYVFQEPSLFAHLNIQKNLEYGLSRSNRRDQKFSFDQVVDFLGITHLLNRKPQALSGGERQRVAIGRAILSAPQILLMDEPLAALDKFAKHEIMPYLEKLQAELAIPMLYVSHDMNEIERLADRMVLMKMGQIQAIGPLDELLADPQLPLSQMPDAASVLTGELVAHDRQYGLATFMVSGVEFLVPDMTGKIGATSRLRIAASDVALTRQRTPQGSSILNAPKARIIDAQPFGDYQMSVFLRLGENGNGAPLLSRITRKSWERLALQKGDRLHALIKSVALTGTA